MTHARVLKRSLLLAVGLLAAAGLVPACGENGESPLCPDVPLYNVKDADLDANPQIQAAIDAAVDAGCMTAIAHSDAGTP